MKPQSNPHPPPQPKTTKSKLSSTDIIRQNQPHNYRQRIEADTDDIHWEEPFSSSSSSSAPFSYHNDSNNNNNNEGITIEFDALPESSSSKRKRVVRRSTPLDKEIAELVHKVHLLCLIARGRLVDAACDDPLIQAALFSLLPPHLMKLSEATALTAKDLTPLVAWFHQNFHVRSSKSAEKPFHTALASALEMNGGSPEEVAALSVALFRALNLTTRFVSILDATSLKPEADKDEASHMNVSRERKGIFDSSTLMVSTMNKEGADTKSTVRNEENIRQVLVRNLSENNLKRSSKKVKAKQSVFRPLKQSEQSDQSDDQTHNASEKDNVRQNKGDVEFEMQLEMALSATALANPKRGSSADINTSSSSPSEFQSPSKKIKRIAEVLTSSSDVISTAIGSKKVGAPLYWAEVYCNGENMSGKWVHVDAVNYIIDGELKVEDAAAACKISLRYVVAFAGHGAKDVTRRYCSKWYKISPKRVDSEWWDTVLNPLKEMESRAVGGTGLMLPQDKDTSSDLKEEDREKSPLVLSGNDESSCGQHSDIGKVHDLSSAWNSSIANRSTLEDMELATRALTEPLPTSQQAYRTHPLYALEKWLTKYQVLHPKGPILGFCSGHAVYPRTCVQTLHTKERWLREGLQVRVTELPAKVVKSTLKNRKGRGQVIEVEESIEGGSDSDGNIALFGKWQTEPLCLPPAVNGIVPRNERGQVDVWSEKCLPPGTVHLRLPRLVPVARRLGIDFAPAMVGFEFRNGRSLPLYEGIVVCTEFRESILEAYAEEEQRREEEEKRKDERQAISRWYQLLSSMLTRQRLNNSYRNELQPESVAEPRVSNKASSLQGSTSANEDAEISRENVQTKLPDLDRIQAQNHEHVFVTDDESFDEENMTRTKRCHCGFSIEVEEL